MIENDWLDFVGQHLEIYMYLPVVFHWHRPGSAPVHRCPKAYNLAGDRRQIIILGSGEGHGQGLGRIKSTLNTQVKSS
jgi:hypothetical protein